MNSLHYKGITKITEYPFDYWVYAHTRAYTYPVLAERHQDRPSITMPHIQNTQGTSETDMNAGRIEFHHVSKTTDPYKYFMYMRPIGVVKKHSFHFKIFLIWLMCNKIKQKS